MSDFSVFWEMKWLGIAYKTWALAVLIAAASVLLKNFVANLLFRWFRLIAKKTKAEWDDDLVEAMKRPVANLILYTGLFAALRVLPMAQSADNLVSLGYRVATIAILFWAGIKALDVAARAMENYGRKKGLALATFTPLFKQISIVILAIIALVMIMDALGYSVGSIIAALGIGGAALAFASQTTIANLYGSIAIALDQPFKVGDYIRIGDIEGKVEEIGLRSTSIRTFGKTLVNIPNNTLANESIENYTDRSHRRIQTMIGIVYSTSNEQIRGIIAGLKEMLEKMPEDIAAENQMIHLAEFADSSINIELICYTPKTDIQSFYRIRQQVLMGAIEVVKRNGSEMAYPTQTIYLAK